MNRFLKRNIFALKRLLGCLCVMFTAMAEGATARPEVLRVRAPYHDATRVGDLQNKAIRAASGMAPSRLDSRLLWIINDHGRRPVLYATGTDGKAMGKLRLTNASVRDWEDLASFLWKGKSYILVADVGDNEAKRASCTLYVVEEPVLRDGRLPARATVDLAWRIEFQYEGGPRDCEAVAVDVKAARILLLSKREVPPVLFELPLRPKTLLDVHMARRLAKVPTIWMPAAERRGLSSLLGSLQVQPTGMDISPSALEVVVLTYRHGYLFERAEGQSWPAAFASSPQLIRLPVLRQAESICFGFGGRVIFVTSERRPAPLLRLSPLAE